MASEGCDAADEFAPADGQGCYRLAGDPATWSDARSACIGWGGDLVRIESAADDDVLTVRLDLGVWIGANDREVEGTMMWADGSPLDYPTGAAGNPTTSARRKIAGRSAGSTAAAGTTALAMARRERFSANIEVRHPRRSRTATLTSVQLPVVGERRLTRRDAGESLGVALRAPKGLFTAGSAPFT